jgi:ATP-dependent Clp protease ATP-binding subunit ClpC
MVFDRFDEAARGAMLRAQAWARWLRHHEIGTGHLLLGLVQDGDALPGRALLRLGVTPDALRSRIEAITPGVSAAPYGGHIPMDGSTKRAIQMALKESSRLGVSSVGPEHLLIGLIKERRGVGARALEEMGVDHRRARTALIEVLEDSDRS